MKKSVTIFILVFIVVTFGGAMYYLYTKNAEDPVVYETEKASKKSIVKKTVATGSILPLEEVFDPTGAGDTFAGGFAGYIAKTNDISFENMKNAVIYGSTLASFSVEKFGTERMKHLTSNEVHQRLLQFKKLTQFEIELT